jgi:phasin family protein
MARKSGNRAVALAAKMPAHGAGRPKGFGLGYDDLATQGKHTLSALVAANAALSRTLERMSQELVGFARASVESAAATGAGLVDARSFEDVLALQYDFAKGCADRLIAGSARLSELALRAASEIYVPLGTRVAQTTEILQKPLTA